MKYCNVLPYNLDIKVAGDVVTIKKYEKTQVYNYLVSPSLKKGKTVAEIVANTYKDWIKGLNNLKYQLEMDIKYKMIGYNLENQKKERFYKSCYRAKQNIFDLVACNVNKHLDFDGKKQTTKFLTLTFKEDIKDISIANAELTKFFKRLSYKAYGIRKNVIKYIAVPELQLKNNRGVWHFHIILFNVKFIKFTDLLKCWGCGGVYINALKKGMDGTEIAKYITKYISKALKLSDKKESFTNYELYKKYNMQNKKRYYRSRKLYKPYKSKLDSSDPLNVEILDYLIAYAKMENGEKKVYFKEYENEYRGKVDIFVIELKKNHSRDFKAFIKLLFKHDLVRYSKNKEINWEKLKNIREKMKYKIFWENEEERLEKEYIQYSATI